MHTKLVKASVISLTITIRALFDQNLTSIVFYRQDKASALACSANFH